MLLIMQSSKIVLQINSVVAFGSTGRGTEELGQVSLANGWDSYIAYGRIDRPSKSKLIKIGTDWDIKLHGLKTRLFDHHGLGSRKATEKLVDQINKIKPDIIHLHNLHGYYLNIEILFKFLSNINIPVVWTFHDCWPMTGHCTHFDFIGCEKWKTECYDCPQKKEYPASWGCDRSKQNFHLKKELFTTLKNLTIVTGSEWLGNIVKQSHFSRLPIYVINNGINTDVFKPVEDSIIKIKYNLSNKFIILGVASIWGSHKGLKDFIELSKQLDDTYQILLVGLTNSQMKTLPNNIIGINRTENIQELVTLYSSADVFINPSLEETFGLTTVEALACGTPAIVFNATASPELLIPETGLVVEKDDMQGLIDAIKIIKEKGKSSFSSACRDRVIKLYDKNNRYMDYLNLYESMLKTNTDIIDI